MTPLPRELVRRLQANEPEAWDHFVRTYTTPVLRLLQRRTGKAWGQDSLVSLKNRVVASFYERVVLGGVDEDRVPDRPLGLMGFLAGVCRLELYTYYAQRGRRPGEIEEEAQLGSREDDQLSADVVRAQMQAALRAAQAQVPMGEFELYVSCLPYQEPGRRRTAREMGVALGFVDATGQADDPRIAVVRNRVRHAIRRAWLEITEDFSPQDLEALMGKGYVIPDGQTQNREFDEWLAFQVDLDQGQSSNGPLQRS